MCLEFMCYLLPYKVKSCLEFNEWMLASKILQIFLLVCFGNCQTSIDFIIGQHGIVKKLHNDYL